MTTAKDGDLRPLENSAGPTFQFTSLTESQRQGLVSRGGTQPSTSAPVTAHQFALSALGASLDLDGAWAQLLSGGGEGIAADLIGWRQITTQGRDQYVRIVEAGYLFPLGHRAVLIEVIDRVFAPDPNFPTLYADAYLQSRTFIRVVEPTKAYPALGQPFNATTWPFSQAQILTLVTPDIVEPVDSPVYPITTGTPPADSYPQGFFPVDLATGSPVLWSVHLTDLAGTVVALQVPLGFIFGQSGTSTKGDLCPGGSEPAIPSGYSLSVFSASDMANVAALYNSDALQDIGTAERSRVMSAVSGTQILYSPEVTDHQGTAHPGGTTHPTLSITLGAATSAYAPAAPVSPATALVKVDVPSGSQTSMSDLEAANQPAFYPALLSAQVRLPAAETLSRSSFDDGSGNGVTIGFYQGYVTSSYPNPLPAPGSSDANAGGVYGTLLNPPALNFPADAVGGISNPNFQMTGLAAAAGAIGGSLDTYSSKAIATVTDYFNNLESQLSSFLGGLPFIDSAVASGGLSGVATPDGPLPSPGILGQQFSNALGVPQITQELDQATGTKTVTYTFHVPIADWPSGSDNPTFQPLPVGTTDGTLTLTATVTIMRNGTATYAVAGSMSAFQVTILAGSGVPSAANIITIPFGVADVTPGATFASSSGSKTSIAVNVGSPTFDGILSFVNSLEDFLDNIGGSGLSIDVAPTSVTVSLTLTLPSVGCGVFNLENLGLSAGVMVPFLDSATVATFGFCSQEQPFTLTVLCFGGGGYLLLGVGLHSIQSVTASFDFEGQLALDLGVASGGVSVAAGITFMYASTDGATLTGFVRIDGEVSVLELISISLTVELMLSYTPDTNTVTGTATMQISVSICFFSISVGITITKSFSGPTTSSGVEVGHAVAEITGPTPPGQAAPTFTDMLAPADWSTYCSAFAA